MNSIFFPRNRLSRVPVPLEYSIVVISLSVFLSVCPAFHRRPAPEEDEGTFWQLLREETAVDTSLCVSVRERDACTYKILFIKRRYHLVHIRLRTAAAAAVPVTFYWCCEDNVDDEDEDGAATTTTTTTTTTLMTLSLSGALIYIK